MVPEHIAQNILARIRRPIPKGDLTGAQLISMAFPLMNLKAAGAVVEDGQLTKGPLKKGATSATIHAIFNDMNPQAASKFINDVQAIVTK